MDQKLSTRPATRRLLHLWLLAAALFAALPPAAQAQQSLVATCAVRHNRADFDGDCKTDISTFNRSTGEWKSLNSSSPNGTQLVSVMWGQSGDIPAPGDYDGGGRTDAGTSCDPIFQDRCYARGWLWDDLTCSCTPPW